MATLNMVPLEEEIQNNPDLRIIDIKALRNWYQKQPHLPKITDNELAIFLHSNYYRLEPTKVAIDSYFTIRTHVPEFFSNKDPVEDEDIRQAMSVMAIYPLSGQTKEEGYDIMLGKLIDLDPSKYNFNAHIKYFQIVIDYFLHSRPLAAGHVLLIDLNGVSFGHAARVNPLGLKKFLVYLQEASPIRRKAVHVFNTPPVMDTLMSMARPFVKKELMNSLHVHSTLDSLARYIDTDMLPNECGGKAGPIMSFQEKTIKSLEENRGWFIHDQENNRINEALRPENGMRQPDFFGMEGSFKKLDID